MTSSPDSEPVDPDAEAFQMLNSGFYRRPDPETAWRAIRHAVRNELFAENPAFSLLFLRATEVYPAVALYFDDVREAASEAEQSFLKTILHPPQELVNAQYLPDEIQSPGEMDLCWGEFLITGELDIVKRIVAVLDREDRSRGYIQEQLTSTEPDSLQLADSERSELAQVGINLANESDPQPNIIMSEGDVDLRLWFGLKHQLPACSKVASSMPEAILLHMACKGAAVWSLQANANQHGKIRLFCEEQSAFDGGEGRLMIRPQ